MKTKVNKLLCFLLAHPIILIIIIGLSSMFYNSFIFLPELTQFISQVHVEQEIGGQLHLLSEVKEHIEIGIKQQMIMINIQEMLLRKIIRGDVLDNIGFTQDYLLSIHCLLENGRDNSKECELHQQYANSSQFFQQYIGWYDLHINSNISEVLTNQKAQAFLLIIQKMSMISKPLIASVKNSHVQHIHFGILQQIFHLFNESLYFYFPVQQFSDDDENRISTSDILMIPYNPQLVIMDDPYLFDCPVSENASSIIEFACQKIYRQLFFLKYNKIITWNSLSTIFYSDELNSMTIFQEDNQFQQFNISSNDSNTPDGYHYSGTDNYSSSCGNGCNSFDSGINDQGNSYGIDNPTNTKDQDNSTNKSINNNNNGNTTSYNASTTESNNTVESTSDNNNTAESNNTVSDNYTTSDNNTSSNNTNSTQNNRMNNQNKNNSVFIFNQIDFGRIQEIIDRLKACLSHISSDFEVIYYKNKNTTLKQSVQSHIFPNNLTEQDAFKKEVQLHIANKLYDSNSQAFYLPFQRNSKKNYLISAIIQYSPFSDLNLREMQINSNVNITIPINCTQDQVACVNNASQPMPTQDEFLLTRMLNQDLILEQYQETFDRIDLIKYITFGVILFLSLLMIVIVMRYSVYLTRQFYDPLASITEFLNNIELENLEDTSLTQFEMFFTCQEIRELIETLITMVNNLKYANQRVLNQNPAIALVEISRAKQFYTVLKQWPRVGICANNIANIHTKNNRFFEAVSEYQEAILMSKIEYTELKQKIKLNSTAFWQLAEDMRNGRVSRNLVQTALQRQRVVSFAKPTQLLQPTSAQFKQQMAKQAKDRNSAGSSKKHNSEHKIITHLKSKNNSNIDQQNSLGIIKNESGALPQQSQQQTQLLQQQTKVSIFNNQVTPKLTPKVQLGSDLSHQNLLDQIPQLQLPPSTNQVIGFDLQNGSCIDDKQNSGSIVQLRDSSPCSKQKKGVLIIGNQQGSATSKKGEKSIGKDGKKEGGGSAGGGGNTNTVSFHPFSAINLMHWRGNQNNNKNNDNVGSNNNSPSLQANSLNALKNHDEAFELIFLFQKILNQLINRNYSLASTLFRNSNTQDIVQLMLALKLFKKCLHYSDKLITTSQITRTIIVRHIFVLSKMAHCCQMLGFFRLSSQYIGTAQEYELKLKQYKINNNATRINSGASKIYQGSACEIRPPNNSGGGGGNGGGGSGGEKANQFKKQNSASQQLEKDPPLQQHQVEDTFRNFETHFFINIFNDIPDDVVHQRLQVQLALQHVVNANFHTAAEILTEVMVTGREYDTKIRSYCLKLLIAIFNYFALDPMLVEGLIDKHYLHSVEVIMLLDYSSSMNKDQLLEAHNSAKDIFNMLQQEDKVGFIVFNDIVHQSFKLQTKGQYHQLLEKKLKQILFEPGGKSNIKQALLTSIKLFDNDEGMSATNSVQGSEAHEDSQSTGEYQQIQNRKSRYIVLFTEGSNQLVSDEHLIIQSLLKRKKIDLLVYNISSQMANMLYLKCLATITESSQFFFTLDEALSFFQKLREKHSNNKLIFEFF